MDDVVVHTVGPGGLMAQEGAGMRRKFVLLTALIIALAVLGGYLTTGAGGSDLAPPPMSFEDQASLSVSDETGEALVCGGQEVTVGYVRQHVLPPSMPPPPAESSGPASVHHRPLRPPSKPWDPGTSCSGA